MDPPVVGHGAGASMQSVANFKDLYEEHYGFVWATVCRFGVTPMLADDAVQDTFIVAYRRRAAFDGQSPKSWLYSIGRRVASNYRRSRGRRESRHSAASDFVRPAIDLESDVSARVSLERFLDSLTPRDRELFVLSELDGLTGPELAATLGRKLPTVYGRVRILRQRFQHAVAAQDATLQSAKQDRPRAKASGWMLLQSTLTASGAVGGSKLVVGAVALAAAALVSVGVVVSQDPPGDPAPASAAQVALAATAREPAEASPETLPPPAASPETFVAPAPTAQPTPPAAQKRRERVVPDAAVQPEAAYDLAADTKLLQAANAALRTQRPKRALELLAEHERRFPSPAQPDLRTAIWVGALCGQGRPADAKRRADALRTARPNSPMLPRIDATCASGKKPPPKP